MSIFLRLALYSLAVLITAYLLPGVWVDGFWSALFVAVVLGVVNYTLKPVLLILTLPINLLTIGLFTFVINAFLVIFVASLVPGFSVDGFWPALFFGIILSIVNGVLFEAVKKD